MTKKRPNLRNQNGFTLIELISVMVIMGVMGSVAIKKVDFMTDTASTRALAIGVKELNVRESLVWSTLDKDMGAKFTWNPGPTVDGGTLHCESQSIVLNRIHSTNSAAGKWQ